MTIMIHPRSQFYGQNMNPQAISDRTAETERHTTLVRRRGGLISVPWRLSWKAPDRIITNRPGLTKLLLNVMIEKSLGPIHVVMSPEDTVSDLIKSAVEAYVREKRRPLVKETDPNRFELHYSQFSLDSLKEDEKLIMLGSRNFFLCSKSSNPAASLSTSLVMCSDAAKMGIDSSFPLIRLMDFLL